MARVFTLNIDFQQEQYTALVSLREEARDMYYVVRYVDADLHQIMTSPQLIFSLHEGLIEPKKLPSEQAEDLMMSTINALSEHLATKV